MDSPSKRIFKPVKDIGVVWATDEAIKLGYYNGNPEWSNLGQGQPETGRLKKGPARVKVLDIEPGDNRYGPVNGMEALRKAIAANYNRLYRKHKSSQYTFENVSIAMGGRLALTRIFSMMDQVKLGYKVPEYPAYEDLLSYHTQYITPVCIPSLKENNHAVSSHELSAAIHTYQLDAFLFSNPCNPTGHVIREKELEAYVQIARQSNCSLIVDEMYSHFIYEGGTPAASPISSAEFIEQVDTDPVLIVDGLTKSFRYPGWRLAWVLGPKDLISEMGKASSGIDGGPSLPVQRAALPLFEPAKMDQEAHALRTVFSHKQTLMIQALNECGITCSPDTSGTFYIWADISALPSPLNNAIDFFHLALNQKVVTLPGYLF
ncbi:MAG TPA: pyridoxal phosphate-dependent aminotransferase, partial [Bacteroidia bacterium]|nr:pyridoxal phosphate-dependent aminotransferase [Bacteroidia bacterium]